MDIDIGKRIKELRLSNQLTQDELAARCDLSAGFISQLESNKTSISIEYLIKLLAVFGESPGDFFSEDDKKAYVYGKKDRVEIKDQNIDMFQLLIPNSTTMEMEPSRILIGKNQILGPIRPHNGEVVGYVMKGRVLISLDKRKSIAKAGCCFQFKADQKHSFENKGKAVAEILLITSPPQF
jgi:transcriptional regulator with XRE-family HTH domain